MRIIQLYDQGKGATEIAASFGNCVAAVRRIRQHYKARGTLKPQTHRRGRKTLLTDARKARLLQLLGQHPDATLAELAAPFKRPTSTLGLWLTRLGWNCKITLHASEQSRPDVAAQKRLGRKDWRACPPIIWCSWMKAGPDTQMTRRYGRSPIGQRLACPIPHGHYRTTTMIRPPSQVKWWSSGCRWGGSWEPAGMLVYPNEVTVQPQKAHSRFSGR